MHPMNHTQAHRYLQAAADNRLEPRERIDLDEHLAVCAECRHYAEQIGVLERILRNLFHNQWDTASERSINLLPGIRTRYHRKVVRKQLFSLANTLAIIGLVIGLLLLLNAFISTRRSARPIGNLTPTPTMAIPTPASPTPIVNIASPTPTVGNLPVTGIPAGSLVFVSSYTELSDLYIIPTDGNGQAKLFDDNLSQSLSPSWSPDGSQLAFVSMRDGNKEIYTIHADGTQPIRLTNNPSEDSDPAWSPDGKSIAFVSDRTGYSEIYVMDTSSFNVTQLTHTQALNTHPTWSPDGAYIAFATNRDGYWQIYRMNADGTAPTNLSNDPSYDDQEPAWSSDGNRIAFASQKIATQHQEIYVMNADGSGRTRLTGSASSIDQTSSNFSPAWSHDSQWIAFCSYRDNPVYGDIYIIPAGNTAVEAESVFRLTTQGGSQPAWRP